MRWLRLTTVTLVTMMATTGFAAKKRPMSQRVRAKVTAGCDRINAALPPGWQKGLIKAGSVAAPAVTLVTDIATTSFAFGKRQARLARAKVTEGCDGISNALPYEVQKNFEKVRSISAPIVTLKWIGAKMGAYMLARNLLSKVGLGVTVAADWHPLAVAALYYAPILLDVGVLIGRDHLRREDPSQTLRMTARRVGRDIKTAAREQRGANRRYLSDRRKEKQQQKKQTSKQAAAASSFEVLSQGLVESGWPGKNSGGQKKKVTPNDE